MKRLLGVAYLIATVFLTSCQESEVADITEGKKCEVSFNVANFGDKPLETPSLITGVKTPANTLDATIAPSRVSSISLTNYFRGKSSETNSFNFATSTTAADKIKMNVFYGLNTFLAEAKQYIIENLSIENDFINLYSAENEKLLFPVEASIIGFANVDQSLLYKSYKGITLGFVSTVNGKQEYSFSATDYRTIPAEFDLPNTDRVSKYVDLDMNFAAAPKTVELRMTPINSVLNIPVEITTPRMALEISVNVDGKISSCVSNSDKKIFNWLLNTENFIGGKKALITFVVRDRMTNDIISSATKAIDIIHPNKVYSINKILIDSEKYVFNVNDIIISWETDFEKTNIGDVDLDWKK